MPNRYLQQLQEDETQRAGLVETLRQSAGILTGTSEPCDALPPDGQARVRHRIARDLLDAAARLCHQVRVTDGRCRYCEAVVVER